ncbi:hypothetical protein I4U23_003607 [Adineta vaga]|nr:hypothetical protein I4U23_003607 [Adineta vaga]
MASNTHPKLYEIRGAQYCKETKLTTFSVYAPNAKMVWVILTAYGHGEMRLPMQKKNTNLWQVISNQAPPIVLIAIFFSVIDISEVGQVQSIVYDRTAYQSKDQNWMMKRTLIDPLSSPLSIYEMQPKSWKYGVFQPINYRKLVPELATYCQRMGFTHVEVYGLLEHSRKTERGYQISNFFAPYHDNGQCDVFKYFVDYLHQHDIGVIIDWIPTHFHHYHASHSFSVSLHEFDGTDLYASDSSRWGTLYLDHNKEETYRFQMILRNSNDISRAITFLRELNDTIHRYYPGVLSIAEQN